LDKPANKKMRDLSIRELFVLGPLVACIVWIGLYPAPILRRVEVSAQALVTQVRDQVRDQLRVQAEGIPGEQQPLGKFGDDK